jgi:Nif-specific regulatory protein
MSPALQAKLLRVIETRVFKRLGGIRDIKLSIRIIAATNKNIRILVDEKKFREDLYFRLNMFHLVIPPLAERRDELLLIAQFFLERINRQLQKNVKHFSDEAQQLFLHYEWPGNLRELRNTIERAIILCDSDTIQTKHLACEMMKDYFVTTNETPSLNSLQNSSLKSFIDNIEKSLLVQALQISAGNQLKAAKILGEPRHIIRYLLKKHNID